MTFNDIHRIVGVDHHDPFVVLGVHPVVHGNSSGVIVRAFLPEAVKVRVIPAPKGMRTKVMTKISREGMFEAVFMRRKEVFTYRLAIEWPGGSTEEREDPYRFLPVVSEEDRYLFNAGDHRRVYEKLGAHVRTLDGILGVHFAVWAPSARSVSVLGDFNGWDGRYHQMRVLGSSGIWEIFIPGVKEGALYKFQIKSTDGTLLEKTDPYARAMEHRPSTASIVVSLDGFDWNDAGWLKERSTTDLSVKPVSVYEVHLGSWMRNVHDGYRWHSYREAAHLLVDYVKARGFTHVELMPIMEHPFDGSWGYQVSGYFAPTSRFGSPEDFMYFVNHCHENGIGVILDWVPAHFPKDAHALGWFDGTHVYEHADPRKGEHQDWGTLIFNYGRNEVRNFLLSNAVFWIDKYHVDGLRIDAVASMIYLDYSRKAGEWLPNPYGGRENLEAIDFLKHMNSVVHQYYPGVLTIAEESTAWPQVTGPVSNGGLGFSMKWNMGWMHDTLQYFGLNPVHRSHHQGSLTFALLYAFSERFVLPFSHDEVVHGKRSLLSKMPGDEWQQFANLRALYALMFGFPGKKLMFMGCEFGQKAEWNHDRQLEWEVLQYAVHSGMQKCVDDLNRLHRSEPSLHEVDFSYHGFEWIDFHDAANSVISFIRWSAEHLEHVVVVCNFTPVPRHGYRIGVPKAVQYVEILNTDSSLYGGSNVGNAGIVRTEATPAHGRPQSLVLTLPPVAVLYLKPVG
ncbi:MAG: 1,4-alpha-glucan branching enzyme [Ignavibacteria bacterium RIFCSPLOWO2_02_FULL_55_14]|nr:MAG: 1,4-alpha-glucan branching enzyme [Ignavibacteria bacterium RIFCSPHIGHO2_02_FULL_56_12]OGU72185.1 MAG: 1,4-alpha-glucan branching enzyme [Ignavibacteria bacterium RIFCSPLOWO2_02_FULL_55_14]